MIKGAIVVSDFYKNNRLFNLKDKIANRDDSLYPAYLLKEYFKQKGVDLSTQDTYPLGEYNFFIFQDFPLDKNRELLSLSQRKYIILNETKLIIPNNWVKDNHKYFEKIFTWADDWVDDNKYVKHCWPNKIPGNIHQKCEKSGLCAMIAGNKTKSGENELYSERVRTIRWFESNHPEDFDLYGMGWDEYPVSGPLTSKMIRKFGFLSKIMAPHYLSYKGRVESKLEVLAKYKFAVCYENVKDVYGYITEKIFDCFFAGCVPIYWGALNITDYIPSGAFIDRRNFKNNADLYQYIKNMPEQEYQGYLKNRDDFLVSDKMKAFSAENFAENIVSNILE